MRALPTLRWILLASCIVGITGMIVVWLRTEGSPEQTPASRALDTLMDDCGLERFYATDGNARLTSVRHPHIERSADDASYTKTVANIRADADIILTPKGKALPDYLQQDANRWSTLPPACAESAEGVPGFTVYFRLAP